jgi:hypothetical protein
VRKEANVVGKDSQVENLTDLLTALFYVPFIRNICSRQIMIQKSMGLVL